MNSQVSTTPYVNVEAARWKSQSGMPTPGVGFMVPGVLSGFGFCAMIGFVIAGLMLLILVQRALAHAAREAAGNAVTFGPIAE